jgi:hypothetical protein
MMRKHKYLIWLIAITMTVVVGTAALTSAGAGAARSKANVHALVSPQNLAALLAISTALQGIPSGVHAPSPMDEPAAGAVHAIGNGKAFAWINAGSICWNAGSPYGVSACIDASAPVAFDAIVHPDSTNGAQPFHVSGIAVNAVSSVTVTLADGSTLTTKPQANWYDIVLPARADESSVTSVSATLNDGTKFADAIHAAD